MQCPECKDRSFRKVGVTYLKGATRQKFQCKRCGTIYLGERVPYSIPKEEKRNELED